MKFEQIQLQFLKNIVTLKLNNIDEFTKIKSSKNNDK